jgi:ribosomal protein L3
MFVRKKEMTRLVYDNKPVVVTLLQILPQEVARIKTSEKDGYVATVV